MSFFTVQSPSGGAPDPDTVIVDSSTAATWPGPSFGIAAAPGVPEGDLEATWYFDTAAGFALYGPYDADNDVWPGPFAFTYSADEPTASDVDGPDVWVRGTGGGAGGGIYGPRTITVSPLGGDLIVYDGMGQRWVAASAEIAVGGLIEVALDALVDGAPGALNTLNELSAALGNDEDFATTVTNLIAGKADTSHNHDSAYAPKTQSINAQSGAYTLVLTDQNKVVTSSSGSAVDLTVPTNASVAFPTGTRIDLAQLGDGQVTVGGSGVTIRTSQTLKLRAKYSGATLLKIATDEWLLVGDLAAS
jgi:hypothetical protein